MKRMYAIIMVEYKKDPEDPRITLVVKETVLEMVYGRKKAEKRTRELEAIYDGKKLIDVIYVEISPRTGEE
jgi:tyrosyl-tRNA synthetase